VSRAVPFLARTLHFLAVAIRPLHDAIYIALWCVLDADGVRASDGVPMACLYSPYNCNRVADGGFCDPVRILLTVLSAWLKTRSVHHHGASAGIHRPRS
jgi:hypothetical protein